MRTILNMRVSKTVAQGMVFAIGLLAAAPAVFAEEFKANTTGDWDVATNWVQGTVPTSFARTNLNNSIITLDTVETLLGGGSSGRFIFGQGGTGSSLTIVSGGSLTTNGTVVHRIGQISDFTLTVEAGGALNVPNADVTSDAGSRLVVTGGDLDFRDYLLGSTSTIEITGSIATFDIADDLSVGATSTLDFTLGATGITSIDAVDLFSITSGASLNIDGSSYTGGPGVIDLVTFGSVSGAFAEVDISASGGFGPGVVGYEIGYDGDSMFLNLLPTPEPSTLILAALGLVGLVGTGRRRRV